MLVGVTGDVNRMMLVMGIRGIASTTSAVLKDTSRNCGY